MKYIKKFQFILLYLLGFIVIGGANLISANIGWAGITDTSIIINNIVIFFAVICMIVGTMLNAINKFKENDLEFNEHNKVIREFALNDFRPMLFTRYANYVNLKRKINQYLYTIKNKIQKLERKATDLDNSIWFGTDEEAKKNNKYCIKRKILENKIDNNYIDKNINSIFVKYDKITANLILGGIFNKNSNYCANDFIEKYKTGKIIKDRLPFLLLSFGITTFASSILFQIVFNVEAVLPFLINSLSLIWQIIITSKYSEDYNQEITLKDIRFRSGIVKEFGQWVKQQPKFEEQKSSN